MLDEESLQIVRFQLAEESYGVEISRIREIIQRPAVTPLPGSPPFVEGVVFHRDRVVPVISLRRRFEMEPYGGPKSFVIVMDIGGTVAGVTVDGVQEVLRLDVSEIEPPPAGVGGPRSRFISGIARVGERLVVLLELDGAFSESELSAIEEATEPVG